MRNDTFTLLKALAITLVVVAHSAAPTYVARFAYLICVPVFFVLSGYFFDFSNLERKSDFIVRRVKRLYFPFVTWSVFFLVTHNLFFSIGILSEQYGNSGGGVTHPYTAHQMLQNLWSIVFNMSGYDSFLGGAFWFFRALLLSNIGFLVLLWISHHVKRLSSPSKKVGLIALLALSLAIWQSEEGLKITGVAQGGYRELMGIFFIAMGWLIRQGEKAKYMDSLRNPLYSILIGILPLMLLTIFFPVSMSSSAQHFYVPLALGLAGVCGFLFLRGSGLYLSQTPPSIRRVLLYVGNNSLYIMVFHLLAFKLVSVMKVVAYGLPWKMIGGHPVVHEHRSDVFWLIYVVLGIALPLLVVWGLRTFSAYYDLPNKTWREWLRLFLLLCLLIYKFVCKFILFCIRFLRALIRHTKQFVNDVIEASKPQDEE